jgi:hypothetical protein
VRSREAPTGPAGAPWHDEPTCRTRRSAQARRPSVPEPAQSAQLAHPTVEEPPTWAVPVNPWADSREPWAARRIVAMHVPSVASFPAALSRCPAPALGAF